MDIPIGRVRHVLTIPPLELAGYMEVVERMARRPGGGRRRYWLLCVLGGLLGAGLGLWLAWAEVRAGFVIGFEGGTPARFGGRTVVLGTLGLMLAAGAAGAAVMAAQSVRAMMRLHRAGPGVMGSHELMFADDALFCRNAHRTVALPWASLTGAEQIGQRLFLIFNGMEVVWLPDAPPADAAGRAGLDAFLEARMADVGVASPAHAGPML